MSELRQKLKNGLRKLKYKFGNMFLYKKQWVRFND